MAEFGLESVYSSTDTEFSAVTKLDETHVIVIWTDWVAPKTAYAAVGVIDGNTVTWGSKYEFYGAQAESHAIAALDSTHFVVVYSDGNIGYARIGEMIGNTITFGDEVVLHDSVTNTYFLSVTGLDSTHFVAAFWGDNGDGTAKVGVTSGTTISEFGPVNKYSTENCAYNKITSLDSNHFVISYQNEGVNKEYCIVGSVTGNVITGYGAPAVYGDPKVNYPAIDALDSSHFILTYQPADGQPAYARMGTVSGDSITYNTAVAYTAAMSIFTSVTALDATHFIAATNECCFTSRTHKGTITGDVISFEPGEVYITGQANSMCLASLNTIGFIIVYDPNSPDRGAGRVWGDKISGKAPVVMIF